MNVFLPKPESNGVVSHLLEHKPLQFWTILPGVAVQQQDEQEIFSFL